MMEGSRPNLRYCPGIFSGGIEEMNEEPQSVQTFSGPRFEPGIFRVRSRGINHMTVILSRIIF
jgi:hypothetical protein